MEELMTLQEVAAYLKMSQQTIYRMAQQSRIPALKVQSRWRFRRSDIESWLIEGNDNAAAHVLVVDDDPDIANLVKMQLEEGGYRASVLGSGRVAIDRAAEDRPDLILLDLVLPDADGMGVLRALKENEVTAEIPVILLTIVPDDGSAWKLDIADYLNKPVAADDLLRSVERAMTWQGRILIVDDDADTVGLLSAAVRQIGFTPLAAVDGYEALAMARRHRPDLILLDLRLPGMDGYEALSHLKRDAVTQAIPIVVISAHVLDTEREAKRLIVLGAASFLPKPFSIGELLDKVQAALRPVPGPALPPPQ